MSVTSSGSGDATSTTTPAATSSTTTPDPDSTGAPGDSTGASLIPPGAIVVYRTPGVHNGDFVGPAGGPEALAGYVDELCESTGVYAEQGCNVALAVIDLPMDPLVPGLFPNQPFYAPDGTRLAPAPGEFLAGPLEASLADAGVFDAAVSTFWTGLDAGLGERCLEWSSALPAANGATGSATMSGPAWLGMGGSTPCNTELPLLCTCWSE